MSVITHMIVNINAKKYEKKAGTNDASSERNCTDAMNVSDAVTHREEEEC